MVKAHSLFAARGLHHGEAHRIGVGDRMMRQPVQLRSRGAMIVAPGEFYLDQGARINSIEGRCGGCDSGTAQ